MPLTKDDKEWIAEQLRRTEATLMMARGVDIDLVRDRVARLERQAAKRSFAPPRARLPVKDDG